MTAPLSPHNRNPLRLCHPGKLGPKHQRRAQLRARRARFSWAWVGVDSARTLCVCDRLPGAAGPLAVCGQLQDREGNFTLNNIISLGQPFILDACWLSIQVSLVTAVGGAIFGFLLAYPLDYGRPAAICALVADDLLGRGLAVRRRAAVVRLYRERCGRVGLVTALINTLFGVNICNQGTNLYTFWGLSVTCMSFSSRSWCW